MYKNKIIKIVVLVGAVLSIISVGGLLNANRLHISKEIN